MDNVEPQKKEEKGKCLMCKFVLIFAFVALLLVLVSLFFTRTVTGAL